MGTLRALLRVLALTVLTLAVYLCLLVSKPVGWLSRPAGLSLENTWVRTWARGSAWVMGLRIRASGPPPKPPFFLVVNHLSYVDIVVLATKVHGRFLAKSEIARWPITGFLASSVGTLFVERARPRDLTRLLPMIQGRLGSGAGVIVFPEGTSTHGERVERFKPSLFEVAVRTECPVYTAALGYSTPPPSPPAHLSVCWWGEMTFLPHFFRLLMLPGIDATVAFGPEPIRADDRKALAGLAQRAVESRFTPVVGSES